MPRTASMPTDLTAPGAIDDLLAFHKATFGDARMELDEGADDADESTVDESDPAPDDEDGEPEGADQLADAGKKALDTMKAQRNAERAKRRALEARLAELEKPAPKEGEAKPVDEAAIRRDAVTKANERIVRSEVKAAAKGLLADPADAFRFLDLANFEVDDDGNVDESDITEAIEDLIKSKPYLAAQGGRRFTGDGDNGPRNGARKSQLTEADLASMKPAEIAKARRDGRLDKLLGKG